MATRVWRFGEEPGGLLEVYISGPMRGYPLYNFPAFDTAEEQLTKAGFDVISPARLDREAGFDPSHPVEITPEKSDEFLDRDFQAIRSLDRLTGAVAVLPGWEKSTGARAEVAIAAWRGLAIILMPGAEDLPLPQPTTTIGIPTTPAERKTVPLATGVLDYFPDALAEVARVSRTGNEQHHPGEPLHWDKTKSTDEADALMRHLVDRGKRDKDGMRHTAKVAWRALALLQRELDGGKEKQ